jgi:hypothetical protein
LFQCSYATLKSLIQNNTLNFWNLQI